MMAFDQSFSFFCIDLLRPQANLMSLCKVTATPYTGEAVARGDTSIQASSFWHTHPQDTICCLQEWWRPHQ